MDQLPYGTGTFLFIGLYLLSMVGLGYLARIRRREESLSEFYLAGKNLGGLVLRNRRQRDVFAHIPARPLRQTQAHQSKRKRYQRYPSCRLHTNHLAYPSAYPTG